MPPPGLFFGSTLSLDIGFGRFGRSSSPGCSLTGGEFLCACTFGGRVGPVSSLFSARKIAFFDSSVRSDAFVTCSFSLLWDVFIVSIRLISFHTGDVGTWLEYSCVGGFTRSSGMPVSSSVVSTWWLMCSFLGFRGMS